MILFEHSTYSFKTWPRQLTALVDDTYHMCNSGFTFTSEDCHSSWNYCTTQIFNRENTDRSAVGFVICQNSPLRIFLKCTFMVMDWGSGSQRRHNFLSHLVGFYQGGWLCAYRHHWCASSAASSMLMWQHTWHIYFYGGQFYMHRCIWPNKWTVTPWQASEIYCFVK